MHFYFFFLTIMELVKKLKQGDIEKKELEKSSGAKILTDLELCLADFNLKLNCTHNNLFADNTFDLFITKLFDLLKPQAGASTSSTRVLNNEKLKETILKKFQKISQSMARLKQFEIKNVELERKNEQLTLELDSLKQAINCKKLYSDGELSVVCNELMKWKSEMKQVNSKVVEQNKLINLLVRQCEGLKNEVPGRLNPIIIRNNSDSSTPSSSLAYETMESHYNDATTTLTEKEVVLQVYQCPKCNLEIPNDIDFKIFTDQVENSSNQKLVCIFCYKFFDKKNHDQFIEHVTNHSE